MASISVIEGIPPIHLNKLVKSLMAITGINDSSELIRSINAGEWSMRHAVTISSEFLKFLAVMRFTGEKYIQPKDFFDGTHCLLGLSDKKFLAILSSNTESALGEVSVWKYSLKKYSPDIDLFEEFLEGNTTFSPLLFWQTIIILLQRQTNNKSGYLSEGVANIFFVWNETKSRRYSANLYRPTPDSVWTLEFRDASRGGWNKGSAVFSLMGD